MWPALPLLSLLLACETDDPVLTGIPDEPLLAEDHEDEPTAEGEPSLPTGSAEPEPYSRPEGVFVDVQHLGGRSVTESRDALTDQLGALQSTTQLPGDDGRELVYDNGTLREVGDRIYMIRVPLPEPLRRADALAVLGFSPQVDRYIVLHREFRLNHQWGFRRIRMRREGRHSEMVTEVEAWKWVPGEHTNRL